MKVYLAGPAVFQPDPLAVAAEMKAVCRRHGLEGLFPLDNAGPPEATAIYRANLELIRQADAVIADMTPFRGPSMDPGTAFEQGFAAALGKLVVGYTADPRGYLERCRDLFPVTRDAAGRWRDAQGLEVEDFGLADNLMMVGACAVIAASFEEAVRVVYSKLTERVSS